MKLLDTILARDTQKHTPEPKRSLDNEIEGVERYLNHMEALEKRLDDKIRSLDNALKVINAPQSPSEAPEPQKIPEGVEPPKEGENSINWAVDEAEGQELSEEEKTKLRTFGFEDEFPEIVDEKFWFENTGKLLGTQESSSIYEEGIKYHSLKKATLMELIYSMEEARNIHDFDALAEISQRLVHHAEYFLTFYLNAEEERRKNKEKREEMIQNLIEKIGHQKSLIEDLEAEKTGLKSTLDMWGKSMKGAEMGSTDLPKDVIAEALKVYIEDLEAVANKAIAENRSLPYGRCSSMVAKKMRNKYQLTHIQKIELQSFLIRGCIKQIENQIERVKKSLKTKPVGRPPKYKKAKGKEEEPAEDEEDEDVEDEEEDEAVDEDEEGVEDD